jgi:hypothetical protein
LKQCCSLAPRKTFIDSIDPKQTFLPEANGTVPEKEKPGLSRALPLRLLVPPIVFARFDSSYYQQKRGKSQASLRDRENKSLVSQKPRSPRAPRRCPNQPCGKNAYPEKHGEVVCLTV